MAYEEIPDHEYTDHGPNPYKGPIDGRRADIRASAARRASWQARPFCDLCGPFRGRYLRRMAGGEYRCRGCDREG